MFGMMTKLPDIIKNLTTTRIIVCLCVATIPLINYYILKKRLESAEAQKKSEESERSNNKIRYTQDGIERKRVDIWDREAWKKHVKVKPMD